MVLINRPMPGSCSRCFCNDDMYRCGLTKEGFTDDFDDKRMDGCELAEIVQLTPCALCKYNPPAADKVCGICPAEPVNNDLPMAPLKAWGVMTVNAAGDGKVVPYE